MKKMRLNFPKNKKVIYVLFVLAAILLLGLTINLLSDFTLEETFTVEIEYKTIACDGSVNTFKTLKRDYPVGKKISIPSPEKSGFTVDKERITATVNSDLKYTVLYKCTMRGDANTYVFGYTPDLHYTDYMCSICNTAFSRENYESHRFTGKEIAVDKVHYRELSCYCGYSKLEASDYHDYEVVSIQSYPSDGVLGEYVRACRMCDHSISDTFTELKQTIIFGGDSVNQISGYSSAVDGYLLPTSFKLVRLASHVPEFKFIEDGCVSVLNGNDLNPAITVELEYDESVWGENAISFKSNMNHSADSKYSIGIGKNHRIIFTVEDTTDFSNWLEWIKCKNCPLSVSPIKLIVTCDFSQ